MFNNDLSNVWAFVVKFVLFTTFCVSLEVTTLVLVVVWTVENRMDCIKYVNDYCFRYSGTAHTHFNYNRFWPIDYINLLL